MPIAKTKILSISALALIAGGLVRASQSTTIMSDPSNTVQSIQKIIFSSQGIQAPSPQNSANPTNSNEIILTNQNGIVHLEGKVFATAEGKNNRKAPESYLSLWGSNNSNSGQNSTILVGSRNRTKNNSSNANIFAGNHNIAQSESQNALIMWGEENTFFWNYNSSFASSQSVAYGNNNTLGWAKHSIIAGNNNFIGGQRIEMDPNSQTGNIFAWSNSVQQHEWKEIKILDPQTSNTLYINSTEGVAINTTTPTATLTVHQMIQIWDENGTCSPDRKGQIIFRNNCFYACSDGQNWDNLAGTPACKWEWIRTDTFPIPSSATNRIPPTGPLAP